MNIEEYYSVLRQTKSDLNRKFPEGFLFVTSLDKFAQVAQVEITHAAKGIIENKLRISTDIEIEKFRAAGIAFSKAMAVQAHNTRKTSDGGGTVFILSK